jgi:hypothetical protein
MVNKLVPAAAAAFAVFVSQALPAAACGGLVAPNGAIRLDRATTLVEFHDGVEHYLTSFSYRGSASSFGWIVPLPAVPEKVEAGGQWTLQRLLRETHPQPPRELLFAAAGSTKDSVEVIQQVQVDALDITVLRGSGQAVLDWSKDNGFSVDAETRDHVIHYAKGSPVFMAAKYNPARAGLQGLRFGDGAPVLITLKIEHPWVPLEILAAGEQVQADLYLLTDKPVNTSEWRALVGASGVGSTVRGAEGFTMQYQAKMTEALHQDLSSDRNMGWVRKDSWLTYLTLDAPDTKVTYDMSITPMGVIKVAPFGTKPMAIVDGTPTRAAAPNLPTAPLGTPLALLAIAVVAGFVFWVLKPREQR